MPNVNLIFIFAFRLAKRTKKIDVICFRVLALSRSIFLHMAPSIYVDTPSRLQGTNALKIVRN